MGASATGAATATPYSDYLVTRLGPALWNYVTAQFQGMTLATQTETAQKEAQRVISTVPAKLFGEPHQWKEARARADALVKEFQAHAGVWKASAEAFDAAFQQGLAISAAATEEDLATARTAVRSSFAEGNYRVTAIKTGDPGLGCRVIAVLTGATFAEAAEVEKSIRYVGPGELVSGVSLDQAVDLKKVLEGALDFVVSIAEGPPPGTYKRQSIPESIRHEVWRRDGGACVDCGSRDRLEFDHIVPVSKGGANTARNIELRCEGCNRKKAAKI